MDDFDTTVFLVQKAQGGSRDALNVLFGRYLPRVRQIAALRVGRCLQRFLEEEDVVQEALLKALKGLGRFEHRTDGTFRNWLARCVESAVVDSARKARARKRGSGKAPLLGELASESLSSSIFASPDPSPSQVLQRMELDGQVEEALLGMEKHHREIIILRKLCGMSYADVAKAMGFKRDATARQACARAIERLKERLGA